MFVGDLVVGDVEGRLMVCLVILSKRISSPPLRFALVVRTWWNGQR